MNSERGFSMLEALVAISLLAIGMAAVASLLVGHLRFGALNASMTEAISLAEAELEDLRGMEYEDVVSRSRTVGQYAIDTSVEEDTPQRFLKAITVSVRWSQYGMPHTYTLNATYADITR